MSETEGFEILNSENAAPIGDKANKTVRPAQLMARRYLVDISNLPEKQAPLIEDKKSQSIPTTAKEYIEKLQKENVALSKMLLQRNKLIELSGIELEKLRLNLIAVQQQNQKLALSHTQMLAELNAGKDKLKELHHALGCQNGLLKARNLEFKGKTNSRPCRPADDEVNSNKSQMEDESSRESRDEKKPCTAKRRVRSSSLGSSEPSQSEENATKRPSTRRRSSARFMTVESRETKDLFEMDDAEFSKCPSLDEHVPKKESNSQKGSSEPSQSEENATKRPSTRRRSSARFMTAESRETNDLFEMDAAEFSKCPSLDEHVPKKESNSVLASVKDEDSIFESREPRRSSLCRPSRMAAKKVQSYKEIPLKVKMRRS